MPAGGHSLAGGHLPGHNKALRRLRHAGAAGAGLFLGPMPQGASLLAGHSGPVPAGFQAPGVAAGFQNAGTTAPLYLSRMNCLTSGVRSAAVSLASAGLLALSVRLTTMLT